MIVIYYCWTGLLKYFAAKPKITGPSYPLPVTETNLHNNHYPNPAIIWFGHSSFLLKTATAYILVDPDFSSYTGPCKGIVPAFPELRKQRH